MALSVSEANSVSRSGYDKMIIKTVYQKSTLYKLFESRKRIDRGGIDRKVPIQYRELDQTEAVDPADVIDYTTRDTTTQATIERRYVAARQLITWAERVENMGEGKIVDLIAWKSEQLAKDFRTKFHGWLYAVVQQDRAVDSLHKLVDDGDLYGVSVANGDAEMFKSQVVYDAGTPWTPKFYGTASVATGRSLAQLVNLCKFDDEKPTHLITSRDMHTGLGALWLAKHARFMIDEDAEKNLGIDNFMFMGLTCVDDYACPDDQLFGLDMNSLGCKEDPNQPEIDDWFSLKATGRPRDMAKVMTWSGNFYIRQRRTSFRIRNAALPTQSNLNQGNLA